MRAAPRKGRKRGVPEPSGQSKSVVVTAQELWELVVAYFKQETVDPLKGLARYVGFGLLGAMLMGTGIFFLAMGGLRALQRSFGDRLHHDWHTQIGFDMVDEAGRNAVTGPVGPQCYLRPHCIRSAPKGCREADTAAEHLLAAIGPLQEGPLDGALESHAVLRGDVLGCDYDDRDRVVRLVLAQLLQRAFGDQPREGQGPRDWAPHR